MHRLRKTRLGATILGGAALLAGATGALAADPSEGTVSKASPQFTWTGSTIGSYFIRIPVLLTNDDTVPCQAPACDSVALKVADTDDLTITGDAPESTSTTGGASQVTLRIHKPDGSVLVASGDASPEKPMTVKIKKAPAGDYVVDYFNYFYDGPVEYTGTATLGTVSGGASTGTGTGGTGNAAPPQKAPEQQQQQQNPPAQDLSVSAKVGKLSARKLKKSRKASVSVTVSREVASITATLKKGKKVVGTGKRGATSGTAKLALKVRKGLKAGAYKLTVAADDGKGTTAIKTIAVKVRK